jgi:thioesterase domain-containing protein
MRHYRAQLNYVPGPFAGRVSLLRVTGGDDEADLGWGVVARGGVDVHIVPGPHADVLKPPNVAQTARRLAAVVDAALSRE